MTNLGSNFFENIASSGRRTSIKLDNSQEWQGGFLKNLIPGNRDHLRGEYSLRFGVICSLICLSLVFIYLRVFHLQVVQGKALYSISEDNRLRKDFIQPERGIITSSDGTVLTRNDPSFSVVLDLTASENSSESMALIVKISKILGISEELLKSRVSEALAQAQTSVVLVDNVDRDSVVRLETTSVDLPGITTKVSHKRTYVKGEAFSHVLGYVGEISKDELGDWTWMGLVSGDIVGKTGIEEEYEEKLHGSPGKILLEKDSMGVGDREVTKTDPVPGLNLLLTIDSDLQEIAYTSLKEEIEKSKAVGGAVIVEKVETGEILSLVSYPSYDANLFSSVLKKDEYLKLTNDPHLPFFDRSIGGLYPPASTFKLVTATAALTEGVIDTKAKINEVQTITVGGQNFSNWTLLWGIGPHGPLNISEAIAQSSDIFFYEVGGGYESQKGLGIDKLSSMARQFGLGTKTGIDLPGEVSGLIPDPNWKKKQLKEDWYLGDTYITAIGQGNVLVQPLQVANFTVTVANGGKVMKPYLVDSIINNVGEVQEKHQPYIVRQISNPGVFATVREGMRGAVEYGTSVELKPFPVPISAKTGTAETNQKDKIHAWFTSFAPYEHPEIVVTVFVEEGGQGSEVALPIAKKVYSKYFNLP